MIATPDIYRELSTNHIEHAEQQRFDTILKRLISSHRKVMGFTTTLTLYHAKPKNHTPML